MHIGIDGREFALSFEGFDAPLRATAPGGRGITLRPWRFGRHLAALDRCAQATPTGLALDTAAFAREVLDDSAVPDAHADDFHGLALWWASGGGRDRPATAAADGEVRCGAVRARLRPWSGGERLAAVAASREQDGEGGTRFHLGRYLRAMLACSVQALEPPGTVLEELDAATGQSLLQAVLALNVADPEALYAPEAARQTLRLCRELGWTPSRVWATPAVELDRLDALLDRAAPATAPVPPPRPAISRSSRLADQPDAVVIRIEDD
ncbi:hypothetical protein [uncultured Azohydromonas sp.]|uniref:hypothetical protein n=1 Tax=uncultured Azohydromonas sp. TaxID=487342 RepID=UPI0026323EFF|nr:hypothetical protein [uncultured Azohydromonas sp.]